MDQPVRKIEHRSREIGSFLWNLPVSMNDRIAEWQSLQSNAWNRLKTFHRDKICRFIKILTRVVHIYSRDDLDRYVDIVERNLQNMEHELKVLLDHPTPEERIQSPELEEFEV